LFVAEWNTESGETEFVFRAEDLRAVIADEFTRDKRFRSDATNLAVDNVAEEFAAFDFSVPVGPGAWVFALDGGVDGGGERRGVGGCRIVSW